MHVQCRKDVSFLRVSFSCVVTWLNEQVEVAVTVGTPEAMATQLVKAVRKEESAFQVDCVPRYVRPRQHRWITMPSPRPP